MPAHFTLLFPETHADFTVTLMKTIRVSNDSQTHHLPPAGGSFQFFMHHHSQIVPMSDKEAMWFSFSSSFDSTPVAVKILAGGINTITGEKETGDARSVLINNEPNGYGQNYMIVPGQPWLSGFKTKDNKVRQFIAVTLGKGLSVEEKLEKTQTGGIQFIVFPIKQETLQKLDKKYILPRSTWQEGPFGLENDDGLVECCLMLEDLNEKSETLEVMGLGAGGEIAQEIIASPFVADDFDPAKAKYIELQLVNDKQFCELNRLPAPPRQPTEAEYTNAGGLWFDYLTKETTVATHPDSRLLALDTPKIDSISQLSALDQKSQGPEVPEDQLIHLVDVSLSSRSPSPNLGFFNQLRRCFPCLPHKKDETDNTKLIL